MNKHEPLSEKVTIRCTGPLKRRIKGILTRNPSIKEAQLLRHLLDAVIVTAETKGISEILKMSEQAHREWSAEGRIPLFRYLPADTDELDFSEAQESVAATEATEPGVFALSAPDESMAIAHIHTGDVILFAHGKKPKSGDIVVAIKNGAQGAQTVIRRYRASRGKVTLDAENKDFEESYSPKSPKIFGVMVGRL